MCQWEANSMNNMNNIERQSNTKKKNIRHMSIKHWHTKTITVFLFFSSIYRQSILSLFFSPLFRSFVKINVIQQNYQQGLHTTINWPPNVPRSASHTVWHIFCIPRSILHQLFHLKISLESLKTPKSPWNAPQYLCSFWSRGLFAIFFQPLLHFSCPILFLPLSLL